jgi:hypothetical protein
MMVGEGAQAVVGGEGAGPLEGAVAVAAVLMEVVEVGRGDEVGRVEGLMMMWMVGQGVMVGWMVEGEGWEWAQGGGGGVARGGAGLLIPSDEKNVFIILYQEVSFRSGVWIRIGSGFSDFVDPDPYWESGSGSRGKKIKKFQWKNALLSYF